MRRLRAVVAELIGLFVDDTALASGIVAWLLVVGLLLPRLALRPWAAGLVLFGGLAALLVLSAVSYAGRQGRPRHPPA